MKPYYCKREIFDGKPAFCISKNTCHNVDFDKKANMWAIIDPVNIDDDIKGIYVSRWYEEKGRWYLTGFMHENFDYSPIFRVPCKIVYEEIKKKKKGNNKYCRTCRNFCKGNYCAVTDADLEPKTAVACYNYKFDKYWREKQ